MVSPDQDGNGTKPWHHLRREELHLCHYGELLLKAKSESPAENRLSPAKKRKSKH
ncbi:MAG: hypothetical protein UW95_C0008G0035 [Parcubacteria group bacterium GW2011_GWC1_45_14]|nr:MAG: hypothetical protein UW95_C0008G0035 [Parcubacteria group bacterium GW2011_GWC1_45_14]